MLVAYAATHWLGALRTDLGGQRLLAPCGFCMVSMIQCNTGFLTSIMKYIFVTGGVLSSVGKGITAGALAALL